MKIYLNSLYIYYLGLLRYVNKDENRSRTQFTRVDRELQEALSRRPWTSPPLSLTWIIGSESDQASSYWICLLPLLDGKFVPNSICSRTSLNEWSIENQVFTFNWTMWRPFFQPKGNLKLDCETQSLEMKKWLCSLPKKMKTGQLVPLQAW